MSYKVFPVILALLAIWTSTGDSLPKNQQALQDQAEWLVWADHYLADPTPPGADARTTPGGSEPAWFGNALSTIVVGTKTTNWGNPIETQIPGDITPYPIPTDASCNITGTWNFGTNGPYNIVYDDGRLEAMNAQEEVFDLGTWTFLDRSNRQYEFSWQSGWKHTFTLSADCLTLDGSGNNGGIRQPGHGKRVRSDVSSGGAVTATSQDTSDSDTFGSAEVTTVSSRLKGYTIEVDGVQIGTEGTGSDVLDGVYAFYVRGNQQHAIKVNHPQYWKSWNDFFMAGGSYKADIDVPGRVDLSY